MIQSQHPIKAVIFDMGNVILKVDHMVACRKFAQFSSFSKEVIYSKLIGTKLEDSFERGFIEPEPFYEATAKKIGVDISFAQFSAIFNDVFFDHDGMPEVLLQVKKRVKVLALSNTNYLHYRWVEKKFKVMDNFEQKVLSFEMGYRKPEPEIYMKALDILQCRPEETVYIDDVEDFVKGARNLGLNGIVFKSYEYFKSELLKFMGGLPL